MTFIKFSPFLNSTIFRQTLTCIFQIVQIFPKKYPEYAIVHSNQNIFFVALLFQFNCLYLMKLGNLEDMFIGLTPTQCRHVEKFQLREICTSKINFCGGRLTCSWKSYRKFDLSFNGSLKFHVKVNICQTFLLSSNILVVMYEYA